MLGYPITSTWGTGLGKFASSIRDEDLGGDWQAFCAGRLADPYPLLATLRDADPVHWSDQLAGWVLTRYDDVFAGLSDARLGNDRIAAYMAALEPDRRTEHRALGEHVSGWLGFTDPPKHTRLRGLVREFFTPALAARLKPSIEAAVASLVDAIGRDPGPVDLVAALAFPLPATIICQVLGIEDDRRDEMKALTDSIVPFTGNIGPSLNEVAGPAHAAVDQMVPFFDAVVQERLRTPREDLITRLGFLERQGELSKDEVLSLVVFTFVAGFETTTSGIANALLVLLQDEAERRRLIDSPELGPRMVDETLRIESPIQMSVRVAKSPVEVRGRRLEEGSTAILLHGAANHDPAQFADPDRLDIGRSPNRHLAFGWANHFCLGAPLARLEIEIATTSFFGRFPNARLADGPTTWVPNMSIRCPEVVPVLLNS